MTAQQRRHVRYSGHVQGVGFRYTTRQIAGRYDVAGFVRNLADGRVQLVAEGEAGELDRFLQDIAETMSDYIREANVDTTAASGEFTQFEIRIDA